MSTAFYLRIKRKQSFYDDELIIIRRFMGFKNYEIKIAHFCHSVKEISDSALWRLEMWYANKKMKMAGKKRFVKDKVLFRPARS